MITNTFDYMDDMDESVIHTEELLDDWIPAFECYKSDLVVELQ